MAPGAPQPQIQPRRWRTRPRGSAGNAAPHPLPREKTALMGTPLSPGRLPHWPVQMGKRLHTARRGRRRRQLRMQTCQPAAARARLPGKGTPLSPQPRSLERPVASGSGSRCQQSCFSRGLRGMRCTRRGSRQHLERPRLQPARARHVSR